MVHDARGCMVKKNGETGSHGSGAERSLSSSFPGLNKTHNSSRADKLGHCSSFLLKICRFLERQSERQRDRKSGRVILMESSFVLSVVILPDSNHMSVDDS